MRCLPKRLRTATQAPTPSSIAASAAKVKILLTKVKLDGHVYPQTLGGLLSAKWTNMRSVIFLFGHGALTALRAKQFRALTRAALIARRG